MELNQEQKAAVEHDAGPLLIIAGAGTGKTRVITNRIVELMKSGKAKPGEILALTFTEKASHEMADRVDQMLDTSYEEINIRTFHSFAESILRESGHEMGIDPGYKILDKVQQWFFVKKHFYEFDLKYFQTLGSPNRFIYDTLTFFSKLKDELITPERYIEYGEKFQGEDREKLLEIANMYKKYQELLIANNHLDFGDLNYYALQLLEKRESVLRKYQERFKYIMVDEFQDTNYAQFKLVLMLAARHKNIAVVGDDDQSIYKWRGVSLSNILQFSKEFPHRKDVVLTQNYRSTQKILDGAYRLIQNNNPDRLEEKIGIDKRITSNTGDGEPIEIHHFPSFVQEAEFIAKKVEELRAAGASYGDFAVLARNNNLIHPYADELAQHDVPYQIKNPKGLLSMPEIKDLVAVARFCANPKDDISMLRILKMDVFGINMSEVLDFMNNGKKEPIFRAIRGGDEALPGLESGAMKVAEVLNDLLEFSRNHTSGHVFNEFLQKSGYLDYLVKNEKYEEMENINEFAKQVAKFEKENEENGVIDFVNYLNLLEESNSTMDVSDYVDKDAVQLLTAHGSKGLEFKYVFVVSAVKQRFPYINRSDTFEVPEQLTKEIFPEGDVHIQEERRLFYVAMTRAEEQLFITYSDEYEGNKKWKVSPFVEEVGVDIIDHEAEPDAIKKLQEYKEKKRAPYELPPFNRTKLSYTQLDTFRTCPLKYNYRYLSNVPVPESHATNFGSSVHEALNDFYKKLKFGDEVSFDLLAQMYEKHWIPYGYESQEHEEKQKQIGLEMLREYYDANSSPWIVPEFLEKNFNLKVGDYFLQGRIDRIDKLKDGTYEVIDYKTGKVGNESDLKKDLQLSVYALACKEILGLEVSKLSLYYLKDGTKLSTTRSADQITSVRDEILEQIEAMKQSDFAPTPGFWCNYCDFRLICPAA